MKPWYVELFGGPISIGDFATVAAAPDGRVRLSVWSYLESHGGISIGNYALICPGVRISSAGHVRLGDSCMLANGVYISDSDWHGLYDRVGQAMADPVILGDNVWVGDSAFIGKGVRIGDNSIIGAGSVVVHSIPGNVVAAGNPARVVKQLDPDKVFTTRRHFYKNARNLSRQLTQWDRSLLKDNTLLGWLRHLLFPRKGD